MYSVDHNDIFDHMLIYCYKPDNLSNIQNVMVKYQYLTNLALSLKGALSVWTQGDN